jgi:hypothetical protein
MPEKKDTGAANEPYGGAAQKVASQESVDTLIRLLQEFSRRSPDRVGTVSPEVEKDIKVVGAGVEVIQRALALRPSPMVAITITPAEGPKGGNTPVRIVGSHFVQGATVRFGTISAEGVTVVDLETIDAITPKIERTGNAAVTVNVVVDSIIGSATIFNAFKYQENT